MLSKSLFNSYRQFFNKFLKGNLIKNFSWNSSGFVISAVISLISAPLYIKFIGLENYGVFVLFNSIIGFMKLGEFGLENTIIKYVSEFNAKKQWDYVEKTLNSILTVYLIVIVVLLILFFIFKDYILEILTINNKDNTALLNKTLVISFFGFFIYLFNGYFLAIQKAFERFRFVSLNLILIRFATVIIGILLAYKYSSVTIILISNILILALNNFFLYIYLGKTFSIKFRITKEFSFFKNNLFHYSKWIWTQNILGILYSNIDKFLITIFVGLKFLAIYHLAVKAAYFIPSLLAKGMEILLPYFAKSQDNYDKLKELFIKGNLILSTILAVIIIILYHLADILLRVWLGEGTFENVIFPFQILLISGAFTATPIITYHLFNGLGYAKENAYLGAFGSLINILSISIFGYFFGFIGILFARLTNVFTSTVARSFSYVILFKERKYLIGIYVVTPLLFASGYIILVKILF